MKILVDANIFTRMQKTGVDFYVAGLVRALAVAMPSDTLVLNYFGWKKVTGFQDIPNIHMRRCWWLPQKMYGLMRHYLPFLPYDLASLARADVYLFPDYGCPPTIFRKPKLVILHDLTYYFYPEYVAPGHVVFLKDLVRRALDQADRIIAISEHTKSDIIKAYGKRDIDIIYSGIDTERFMHQDSSIIAITKTKYKITGDYILFASTIEPRKNLERLLDALQLLPDRLKKQYSLVIVGKEGWIEERVAAKLQQTQAAGVTVIRTGYITDSELPVLYSGASLFAYPSLYEGFGMPILEAMACGCPVLTANTSSMPEVAGGAAVIVDPYDVQAIADGLQKILVDPKLAKTLIAAGEKRVDQFTWKESGEQLAGIIKKI